MSGIERIGHLLIQEAASQVAARANRIGGGLGKHGVGKRIDGEADRKVLSPQSGISRFESNPIRQLTLYSQVPLDRFFRWARSHKAPGRCHRGEPADNSGSGAAGPAGRWDRDRPTCSLVVCWLLVRVHHEVVEEIDAGLQRSLRELEIRGNNELAERSPHNGVVVDPIGDARARRPVIPVFIADTSGRMLLRAHQVESPGETDDRD